MKYHLLTLLCFVPFNTGAQNDPFSGISNSNPPFQEDETFRVFPDPEGRRYFPEGTESYYTRYLSEMKEPSLLRELEEGEDLILRFTYLRSFDDPIMVRVAKVGDILKIRSVIVEMGDNYELTQIIHDEEFALKAAEAEELLQKLKGQDFWKPINDAERYLEGLDGSTWVFERLDEEGYRMVDPWSPSQNALPEGLDIDELRKKIGFEATEIRNYDVYIDVGYGLLRIAKILPEPEFQY